MSHDSLEATFLDEFGGRGLDVDGVRFAADFTRLVVRSLGLTSPSDDERRVLEAAVQQLSLIHI